MSTDEIHELRERVERLERERAEVISGLETVLLKLRNADIDLGQITLTSMRIDRGRRHKNIADETSPLMSALTNEYQTVKELWRSAQEHGYTGVENLIRYHMPKLMEAHPSRIEQQDKPLAWRLIEDQDAI